MIATERASYILNKLRDKDTVTLKEIAAELGVSEATVRRTNRALWCACARVPRV